MNNKTKVVVLGTGAVGAILLAKALPIILIGTALYFILKDGPKNDSME